MNYNFFSPQQIDDVNTRQFYPKKKVSERGKAWTKPFYKVIAPLGEEASSGLPGSHQAYEHPGKNSCETSDLRKERWEKNSLQWTTPSSLGDTPHCPTPSQFYFRVVTTSDCSTYPGDTMPQGSNASPLLSAGTKHQTWAVISPKLEKDRAAGRQKDVQGGRCFQDLPVAWWVERF